MSENKKSTKGMVSLIAALLCIGCIIGSLVPFTKITIEGTSKSFTFFSDINVILAVVAIPLALIAIIAGAMAGKDKDKSGPKRVGMVIGIIGIIVAIFACGVSCIMNEMGKFVSGKDSVLTESAKNDPNLKKQLDDFKKQITDAVE